MLLPAAHKMFVTMPFQHRQVLVLGVLELFEYSQCAFGTEESAHWRNTSLHNIVLR
jgi:hypothetical protein